MASAGVDSLESTKCRVDILESRSIDSSPERSGARYVYSLAFVDRKQEALSLCQNMLRNQKQMLISNGCPKPILISAGQMFGSGKSMMGQYATKALKMYPDVMELVRHFDDTKHSSQFNGIGLLSAYLQSIYIWIELDRFSPHPFSSLSEFLSFALYRSIMKVMIPKAPIRVTDFEKAHLSDPQEVIQYFQAEFQGSTFFLHWDEVGVVELDKFTFLFGKEHNQDLKFRMERYYKFWLEIRQLLSMEGVYVFVTDKRPAFALIGHGSIGSLISPTDHHHIVIGCLRPKDIVATFLASSTDRNTSLGSFVKVDIPMLDFFGKEVHACTGGLPRLTQKTLEALCNLQQEPLELKSRSQITAAIERCYSIVRKYVIPMHNRMDIELQTAYLVLMMVSLFKQSVPSDSELTIGCGEKFSILDVVEKLDIAIDYVHESEQAVSSTKSGESLIVFRFSKWVLRRVHEMGYIEDVRFGLLTRLLPMADLLDTGAPFEWILRVALVMSLGRVTRTQGSCTWNDIFPFFGESLAGSVTFKIDYDQPLCFVPAVGLSNISLLPDSLFDECCASPVTTWERKMSPRDLLRAFGKIVRPFSFVLPAPQSASPDLIFNGAPTDTMLIGWAVKQNSLANAISWAIIQNEITKAAPLLAVKNVCLVITALHLGQEVLDVMGTKSRRSSSLFLASGNWTVRNGALQQVKPNMRGGRNKHLVKLRIPDRLELLILGQEDLKSLVGEDILLALQQLVADRRKSIPSLFQSILEIPARRRMLHDVSDSLLSIPNRKRQRQA